VESVISERTKIQSPYSNLKSVRNILSPPRIATMKLDKKYQAPFKVTDYSIFHDQLLKILAPILAYQNKETP